MKYTWENESLEKYGEEITMQLIEQENRYAMKKEGNNCSSCGINSVSAIIEADNGKPFIMHYGNFRYSQGKHKCCECGKHS